MSVERNLVGDLTEDVFDFVDNEVETDIIEDSPAEEVTDEDVSPEEAEETVTENETEDKKLLAEKYHTQNDLIKGYTNLVNAYKGKIQKLAELSGDQAYLESLQKIKKEFETVEELEDAYRELNRDFSRQTNLLKVYRDSKQQPPQPAPPAPQNPVQQSQVIPPELANNPQFMQLVNTDPTRAIEQIVQYRVQQAVAQQQQTYQQQLFEQQRRASLEMQAAQLRERPDYPELQDDIVEVLQELPALVQQPNGLMQAYEYAQLKKMKRELSENAFTATQIKIASQKNKQKASAPVAKSGFEPADKDDELFDFFGKKTALDKFLE